MHSNTRLIKLITLVLFLGIVTVPAWGASKNKGPVIEPRARQVLQKVGDFMKSAQNFTFKLETYREIIMDTGQPIEYSTLSEIGVRKPDRVRIITSGDMGDFSVWYDGSHITVYNADRNIYSQDKVPDTIDAAFSQLAKDKGITPPMISLLYKDPVKLWMERVKSGFYVGLNQIRGVECHHLAFTSETGYSQIWVSAGFSPVILKVMITKREQKGAPQYTAYLSDWDMSPYVPDSLFVDILPKNALLTDISKLRVEDSKDQ